MRGRKPKPRQLHLVDGTYRPDRHDDNAPLPSGRAPKRPPFIRGTARREWERIVPELEKLGILDAVDQTALAIFCQARADYSWAVYQLEKKGRIYLNAQTGVARVNPAVRIQKEAAEVIRKFAAEFGLTPSSRSRLSAPPDPDDYDPEDREFFGG